VGGEDVDDSDEDPDFEPDGSSSSDEEQLLPIEVEAVPPAGAPPVLAVEAVPPAGAVPEVDAGPRAVPEGEDRPPVDPDAPRQRRGRRHRRGPRDIAWTDERQKAARIRGEAHTSRKGKIRRAARLNPPCDCKASKLPNSPYQCNTVDEDDRKKTNDEFWKLGSWNAKQEYVRGLVDTRGVKRNRKGEPENESRERNFTMIYHLRSGHTRTRVCSKMFLATLDMKEFQVRAWTKVATTAAADPPAADPPAAPVAEPQGEPSQNTNNKVCILYAYLGNKPSDACRWLLT
jgi:hypothetical protein